MSCNLCRLMYKRSCLMKSLGLVRNEIKWNFRSYGTNFSDYCLKTPTSTYFKTFSRVIFKLLKSDMNSYLNCTRIFPSLICSKKFPSWVCYRVSSCSKYKKRETKKWRFSSYGLRKNWK